MRLSERSLLLKILGPAIFVAAAGVLIVAMVTAHEVGRILPVTVRSSLYAFYVLFGLFWVGGTALAVVVALRKPCRMLAIMVRNAEQIAQGRLIAGETEPADDELGVLAGAEQAELMLDTPYPASAASTASPSAFNPAATSGPR